MSNNFYLFKTAAIISIYSSLLSKVLHCRPGSVAPEVVLTEALAVRLLVAVVVDVVVVDLVQADARHVQLHHPRPVLAQVLHWRRSKREQVQVYDSVFFLCYVF